MLLYHVTETAAVESVVSLGLVPSIGPRAESLGEPVPAIWFFTDQDGVDTALSGWLGEWYEYDSPGGMDTELSLLDVEVPDRLVCTDEGSFEAACYDPLPASCIVRVRHGY